MYLRVLLLFTYLSISIAGRSASANAECIRDQLIEEFQRISETKLAKKTIKSSASLKFFLQKLGTMTTNGKNAHGSGLHVMMSAMEVGRIPGLKTAAGKSLNVAAGGVAAVMNDFALYYPEFLAQSGGKLTIVGLLMDEMSTEGMVTRPTFKVTVDGAEWEIGVHEYADPRGATYLFLDNPSFRRFTVEPKGIGQSIYTLRGLEDGTPENRLEEQKIWSAFNQAIAHTYQTERADLYMPQDSHTAPASFYISKQPGITPIALKPLIHNEGYVGTFEARGPAGWKKSSAIWNISETEYDHYFRQGDQLVMLAPAVRVAEELDFYTGLSVSDGSATQINLQPSRLQIDFFKRIEGLTNGLGNENRPHRMDSLKPATEEAVRADGITNPEVIEHFVTKGFAFGTPGEPRALTLDGKRVAKTAIQKNFGMTVSETKPLFLGWARLVHQKGFGALTTNIEHILSQGGQVVIGGPVGDVIGAEERAAFIALKKRLVDGRHPQARNFVFLDGPVKGHLKGLLLAGGDFFLIPSRYEPCGLTDIEALYCGVVPIAHDVGGLGKGKHSILYRSFDPDQQSWDVGQAINQAFSLFRERQKFHDHQLGAMGEDFSMEKNFGKFLAINRVETIGKVLKVVSTELANGHLTEDEVKNFISVRIIKQHPEDIGSLRQAIQLVKPSRRNAAMSLLLSLTDGQ